MGNVMLNAFSKQGHLSPFTIIDQRYVSHVIPAMNYHFLVLHRQSRSSHARIDTNNVKEDSSAYIGVSHSRERRSLPY